MPEPTSSIFVADAEGFREQQLGRPAAHLVREAVQNVFDEAATRLDVTIETVAGGACLTIEDDVPGGIRDERLIWTIWMSDKADAPTKRGRMGRGLKELISVADDTLIISQGIPAVEFVRHPRGRWERSSPRKVRPTRGTVVDCHVKAWKKRDVDAIVDYLRRMRPPVGLAFTVNGAPVVRQPPTEAHRLTLPTVVFVNEEHGRVERERRCETTVELLQPTHFRDATVDDLGAPDSWLYEMGIPVEPIDYPFSIDVGQRVPLREKRDTVTERFRRELYAKLLDARVHTIAEDDFRASHAIIAAQAPEHLSSEAKRLIANAWTNGKPYATSAADLSHATGRHIETVPLRKLPEAIRDVVREAGTNVRERLDALRTVACREIPQHEMTPEQRRFVRVWTHLVDGIGRRCRIRLAEGRPSDQASFHTETKTLTVYVENVGDGFIADPLSSIALSLLIHELGHWTSHGDEHGAGFHSDVEDVGGALAAYVFGHRTAVNDVLRNED